MTKKQFEKLQPFEKYLTQAYKHNYINAPSLEALTLFEDILNAIQGTNERYNKGCGACQLKLAKRMGELYFKYKEEQEQQPPKDDKSIDEKRRKALEKARAARKRKVTQDGEGADLLNP